jgi:hypothetical protein
MSGRKNSALRQASVFAKATPDKQDERVGDVAGLSRGATEERGFLFQGDDVCGMISG